MLYRHDDTNTDDTNVPVVRTIDRGYAELPALPDKGDYVLVGSRPVRVETIARVKQFA